VRWLRGLGALVVLGTFLLGAPFALLGWGRIPSGLAHLTRPDDGGLLLAALTVVGWLAWLAFALATTAEAIRLGGRRHRAVRLPLLGGMQQLSAGLLVAVLALAPNAAAPALPRPPVAAAEPEPTTTPLAESDLTATAASALEEPADDHADAYLVEPGDDLWSITADLLGDGSRWRELAAANPELLRDPTERLAAGVRLALPASARTAPRAVTVHCGDTLSGLAREHLGGAGRWPRIAAANPKVIENPDHIEVGWRLVIPTAPTSPNQAVGPHKAQSRGESADRVEVDESTAPTQGTDAEGAAGQTPASEAPDVSPTAGTEPAPDDPSADSAPALPLLGALGTLAAAAIIGVVETRRFLRLRERPLGRRLVPPEQSAARLRGALGVRQEPDRLAALDAALRAVGRYCYQAGVPLPELERVVVGQVRILLEWTNAAGPPPPGFTGTPDCWEARVATPPDGAGHPCPYPAVVSLGSTAEGDLVLVDAERSGVLGVATDDAELGRSALAAMGVELACAPWSEGAQLVVAGADAEVVALAGGERVELLPGVEEAVSRLRAVLTRRRHALGAELLASLRIDPDRADAVASVVFCLLDDVPTALAEELDELLSGPGAGIGVLLAARPDAAAAWQVGGDVEAPRGRLFGIGEPLRAHAIGEATRTAVTRLFHAADSAANTLAPWWRNPEATGDNVRALPQRAVREGDSVDIVRLVPAADHPQVLLIGPVELLGAAGPGPTRSRQQLVELCAWLLQHPGSTATAMAAGLLVAESTRRSNLSRLRSWLGSAPDGSLYLPDAYSGRVLLHPGVTSDWHRLQVLLAPGVNRVGDSTLVAALDLVRGAPLADAAPTQWHWAEELRTDVSSALRDVGVVLTDRALARGDVDLARWAASRALVVAPEDELLLGARIRTELRASNTAEVERLVNHVTRQARILGVDLLPETIELCQQALEGRVRARA